jgi:hypothetical protein
MALPNNTLQQVITYQDGGLAFLQNAMCFVSTSNTRFHEFPQMIGNLGSTVSFDLPPRYVTTNTLVATFQPSIQRVQNLTVDQAVNTSYAFSSQQFIFNVREYMEKFGKSAILNLANTVEANIALNAISGVINNDPTSPGFGTKDVTSGPYRFYGDGVTAINSFGQLAQMIANFRDFGCPAGDLKVYLPLTIVPQIVNSGLNQFAMTRNNEMANSWYVGNWMGVEFYQSNLLPQQVAGNVGQQGRTLTLVSTNDPTGNNVTQLTFTDTTATDANAVLAGDLFQFQDGVSGQPNMRFLTWTGYVPSRQPVQFRATANAATSGSSITITVTPALVWASGNSNQNLNNALAAGMQVKALPSHTAGLIVSGDALFIGMPRLPDQPPFPTANEADPDSGVSMRMYYGTLFGQNQSGFVHDIIWGSTLVQEYSMRIAFSLTQ